MEDTNSIRILVLTNEKSAIFPALIFLRKRGYKIKVVYRLLDAAQELSQTEPDVLLMSWSLNKTDVRKAYKLLSEKFSAVCFVFGEENTPKTARQLMASGIPNTLLPPVTGPSAHMRIQSLIRKKMGRLSRNQDSRRSKSQDPFDKYKDELSPTEIPSEEFNFGKVSQEEEISAEEASKIVFDDWGAHSSVSTQIDPKDVPPNAKWELYESGKNGAANVWQGVSEEGGSKSYYYFQGPQMPENKNGKWSNLGNVKMLTHTDKNPFKSKKHVIDLLDSMAKISETENSLEDFEQALNNIETKNEDEEVSGQNAVVTRELDKKGLTLLKFKNKKTIFANALNKVVSDVITIPEGGISSINPIHTLTKVISCVVKTPKFHGYLIAADASDTPDHPLMNEILEKLKSVLSENKEPLEPIDQIMTLDLDPMPFMLWAESKAEFFVRSIYKGNEVAYAYIKFKDMPEVFEEGTQQESFLGIKLKTLYPNKKINFDLHLYMPKNDKYLLYQKNAALLDIDTFSKLTRYGVEKMFIRKSDKHSYQQYCAKNKLAETYEEFVTKKSS